MGTLAVTGGGASYAYLVMKSQFLDKLKPGLMNVEKEEKGTELKYALLQHDFRNNPIRCFNWCQTKRLLRSVCPKCPTELVAKNAQLGGNIKCGSCGFVTHAFRGTWFEDLNCAPWQALSVMYHFANGDSIHKAAKKLKLSPEVANHWYDKCQVIAQAHLRVCTPKDVGKRRAKFDDPQEEYDAAHYVDHKYQTCPRFMVGGYGKVVEVDLVPVDKIFDGEWGLLILEKDTWRCYVLSINDPSMDYITRSLKGRVRENTKVYCNFVEAGVPNPSAKNAKGAAPFDVNDDGDLVPDVEGRRKKLVNTELLLKHVLEYTQGEKIEDPDELQTALVQFMWIRAFTNEDKASDVEPFMTFVNQVAKFFKVEGDSKTSPAKKMMYTIDRNARAVDSDAEKEISDADDYLDDFGGKSPFDSGIPSPIPAL
jgi:ribosomal protein S27AE